MIFIIYIGAVMNLFLFEMGWVEQDRSKCIMSNVVYKMFDVIVPLKKHYNICD
jgi:NADH:ubiquinone oxidoreductase subunit 6 (subunit J)